MRFYRVVQHTVDCHHSREYVAATANGDADRPRLAVKQYIPLDNPDPRPGDVTIIAAHANGFPKELYEPLWDDLHARVAQSGVRIRSIWIADMWNQGQSGVLNEKILGNDPSWWDHTRDLMHLINQKRDDMPHPLVGIGHSMGGAQLTLLALSHPRLLHSLVLLDPVIQEANAGIGPAVASTSRRDLWDSREDAAARFAQNRFYQAWDPRVLERWVDHGLRPLPTELYPVPDARRVTLTTTKHQELFTFLRPTYRAGPAYDVRDRDPAVFGGAAADDDDGQGQGQDQKAGNPPGYPFYRPEPVAAFRRLPELRPAVLYVFGARSELSGPEARRQKMERTGVGVGGSGGAAAGRVGEVVLDCGHLVAMERVGECADAIAGFLGGELARWRRDQREFAERQRARPRIEQMAIDDQWRREIRPRRRPGPKM